MRNEHDGQDSEIDRLRDLPAPLLIVKVDHFSEENLVFCDLRVPDLLETLSLLDMLSYLLLVKG